MNFKDVKGVRHYVYDLDELPSDIKYKSNWREGDKGDWVLTDDDCVVQVLFRGTMKNFTGTKENPYIRTICGTYYCSPRITMTGAIPDNIYSISGKNHYKVLNNRKNLNAKEMMFVRYISTGDSVVEAYMKSFPTNNEKYAERRSQELYKTNRVQNMISEEAKKALEEEGVTHNYLIGAAKHVVDNCEKDSDRLRGIEYLSKVSGLLDKEQKKEQLTVFQGFTDEQIKSLQGNVSNSKEARIIAHSEKE